MRQLNHYDFENLNEDEINKMKQDLENQINEKKAKSN